MYAEKSITGINIMDLDRREAILVRDAMKLALSRVINDKCSAAVLNTIVCELEPLCTELIKTISKILEVGRQFRIRSG